MIVRKTSSLELLIVVAISVFLFFYGSGNFGLVGADEPRYAQIAREMLERHDFVSPTLNGEPWLEKPVLYYWLGMASFKIFGVTDTAARIPSAALALGMVLAIFFYMRRFRPGTQLDAGIITASCAVVFAFSRGASTDMPLTASFSVAMLVWYVWYQTGRNIWLLTFYFFLGLATLAKGPVAPFLGGLIVLVFSVLRRDIKTSLRTLWLPGVLLYLAVVLPWFVAVQMRDPQFLYVFILEHNLARFGSNMFHHKQPLWYYIPVFILAVAPWTFFAIAALVDALKWSVRSWRIRLSEDGNVTRAATTDGFAEFLVLWTLLPILFFSLSQSKLPGYILPSIPPCAILTADYLGRRRGQPLSALLVAGHCGLLAILLAFILAFPSVFIQHVAMPHAAGYTAGLLSLIVFSSSYYALRKTGAPVLRLVTLAPVIFMVGFILKVAAPSIDDYYSARPVAIEVGKGTGQSAAVAVYEVKRELRYGLSFYRNQNIANYDDNEIPRDAHILIAKAGSLAAVSFKLKNRKMVRMGSFPSQRLEYFLVSAADSAKPKAAASLPAGPGTN